MKSELALFFIDIQLILFTSQIDKDLNTNGF